MKEHADDALSSVKESTATVDSTTNDETVTERGKIEAIFGERESEDIVVDVVSADVVVDEGSERETVAGDHVMEDVGAVKEGNDDLVGDKVKSLEKVEVVVSEEGVKGSVEVVKAVIEEKVVSTVVSGTGCDEQKSGNQSVIEVSEAGGGEIEVKESVQEVADEKAQKETEVLSSSKIPESTEGHVVVEEGVDNQSSLSEVVDAGTCEDNANVSPKNMENQAGVDHVKKESLESTIEATDSQKSENVVELDKGVTEETVESVKEAADVDCVISEKTGKDEILDSTKIKDSVIEVDEVTTNEGLAGKDETQDGESEDQSKIVHTGISEGAAVHKTAENLDQKNKEEGSQSTIEVRTHDASESGKETETEDSKMVIDPDIIIQEIDVMDKGDDEQPVNSVQQVADEDPGSSKIPRSAFMASVGLEEADVDVVDEGLETKNEDQDPVSVEPSLVNPDNQSILTEVTGEVDQKAAVDSTSKTVKPDEVTVALKEPNSDVQVSAEPDVVAYTEPESTTNKLTPGDEITTSQTEHGVLAAHSEFSCEDAHMERGEDVGMDIDEVLGWKDEIPPVQEHEQNVDPTYPSNVEVSLQQPCYFHPPEQEGEFSVSDLVWGKVRTHPWWPGQIFDPSDASEKAMKYHKKDCFLVAYFGDRTFAWNDATVLKPFRENFSQIVDRIDSEAFNNAVHCALQEVSRRVELGLTCSCIPQEIYENIKCQIMENSGIKQESSRRHGVDESASVNSFEPNMLVDYVKLLAKFPQGEGDKMELTIAKAQLSSYGRFKGHRQLAEFLLCGDLLEADQQVVKDEPYSEDGSKKRKSLDSISETVFKVGGSIQKVASQLTGPVDQVQNLGPTQPGNQADMLSQLHQTAQDPMKGYGFVNSIIPFFNSHRATVLTKSRKRKTSNENENESENFEFDDVNDSYWTDRIIQNYPEENNKNGGGSHQIIAYEQEKQPVTPARRSNKKRFFNSNHEIEAKEQSELIERRRKNLATEVLMKFNEGVYFPSEIHLNKMFKRFGPLMESETEVDRQSGRARVVFKKCSDAEVAHGSAAKFNIFGSIDVNYELNYTPLISYKPLPLPVAQDQPHACW